MGKLLKGPRGEKNHLTYAGEKIRITENFSKTKIMQTRRELNLDPGSNCHMCVWGGAGGASPVNNTKKFLDTKRVSKNSTEF